MERRHVAHNRPVALARGSAAPHPAQMRNRASSLKASATSARTFRRAANTCGADVRLTSSAQLTEWNIPALPLRPSWRRTTRPRGGTTGRTDLVVVRGLRRRREYRRGPLRPARPVLFRRVGGLVGGYAGQRLHLRRKWHVQLRRPPGPARLRGLRFPSRSRTARPAPAPCSPRAAGNRSGCSPSTETRTYAGALGSPGIGHAPPRDGVGPAQFVLYPPTEGTRGEPCSRMVYSCPSSTSCASTSVIRRTTDPFRSAPIPPPSFARRSHPIAERSSRRELHPRERQADRRNGGRNPAGSSGSRASVSGATAALGQRTGETGRG